VAKRHHVSEGGNGELLPMIYMELRLDPKIAYELECILEEEGCNVSEWVTQTVEDYDA